MTLYQAAIAAGIPIDSHESDLYMLATEEARALIHKHGKHGTASLFRSEVDGRMWWDVPFSFDPWWERRAAR